LSAEIGCDILSCETFFDRTVRQQTVLHRRCKLGAGAQALHICQRACGVFKRFSQARDLHNVRNIVLLCPKLPTAQKSSALSACETSSPCASALGMWAQSNATMTKRTFMMNPAFRTADGRTFES
jgi:hypothetical protein